MIEFSGSYGFLENTRLSGAFGSMQHLSIVIAILSLITLSIFIKSKKLIDATVFILLMSVLVISYTRIGYLIFGLSLAFYLVKTSLTARHGALYKSVFPVVFGSLILTAIAGLFFDDVAYSFLERVNGISFKETSNKERMMHWEMGLAQFISGPILIGSQTGIASQIPKIIFGEPSFHYESGNLQYLVNFGVIFWLIILTIFLKWSILIPKESPLKHLPLVLTLALFIYMFNEIAPVYITFVLASICIIAIYHDKQKPSNENE
ncbi:O-antigen ligase family protein [Stutzerimonas kunmingensis]|uniref:O-antigen ligase family protein n=1 Tax=Stutzerimonas kunmingensis TaxID=1211807 RepID=UPI00289B49F7|nr:O-antigen ligase family protein [Stutzerimonas kunmingensis]